MRPVIFGITPPSATPGGPDLPITITGAGFSPVGDLLSISNAGTTWVSLTSFVNPGQITGTILAAALSSAGSISVMIQSELTGVLSTPFSFSVAASAPATLSAGIVNAASFLPAIAPGSLITIYGTNLSAITAAADYPLPFALAGTSVSINGGSVPLLFVSPAQINAQVPYEITPGAATLLIQCKGQSSAAVTFAVAAKLQVLSPAAAMRWLSTTGRQFELCQQRY